MARENRRCNGATVSFVIFIITEKNKLKGAQRNLGVVKTGCSCQNIPFLSKLAETYMSQVI